MAVGNLDLWTTQVCVQTQNPLNEQKVLAKIQNFLLEYKVFS